MLYNIYNIKSIVIMQEIYYFIKNNIRKIIRAIVNKNRANN